MTTADPLDRLRSVRSTRPPRVEEVAAAASRRRRVKTIRGAAGAGVAAAALAIGMLALPALESGSPTRDDVAWQPPEPNGPNTYLQINAGAREFFIPPTFEEMARHSDWVVMGTVLEVVEGRYIEGDPHGLQHAEVLVSVQEELTGQPTESALADRDDEGLVARVEFVLDEAELNDLASLFPSGEALWFLHHKTGEGEAPYYRLDTLSSSLLVEESDGTVGLPLAPTFEPGVDLPEDLAEANAADAEPPSETHPSVADSIAFEQVLAAISRT